MIRTLLPILLFILPIPAQSIERQDFLRALRRAGVSVTEQSRCGNERNNVALYYYHRNQICISSRHTPTMNSLDQALTHEAVHAAQDCLAGQHNGRMTSLAHSVGKSTAPFIDWLQPGQLSFIKSSYSPNMWDLEIEAYALESRPDRVAQILSAVCR